MYNEIAHISFMKAVIYKQIIKVQQLKTLHFYLWKGVGVGRSKNNTSKVFQILIVCQKSSIFFFLKSAAFNKKNSTSTVNVNFSSMLQALDFPKPESCPEDV